MACSFSPNELLNIENVQYNIVKTDTTLFYSFGKRMERWFLLQPPFSSIIIVTFNFYITARASMHDLHFINNHRKMARIFWN